VANNPFVHVELATSDLAKAKDFYAKLFDWELDDSKMDDYTLIGVGEHEYGVGGGMMKAPMPNMPSSWLAYVAVSDVTTATEKAKSLGATIIKEVTPVEGFGWFSIIRDPTGAVLGLWKSVPQDTATA
jgi:predicted enzyme related to lactoylglutathione lyase